MVHSLVVLGDHFQVLVGDSKYGPMIDTSHLWDSAAGVAQLPDQPQLIGIPTIRYGGLIAIELEIAQENFSNFPIEPVWTPIGEFSITTQSGELIFWGPELQDLTLAPRVLCQAGTYRGIAFSSGSTEVVDELLPEGPDRYRLRMSRIS
jgi:hypothetical protein